MHSKPNTKTQTHSFKNFHSHVQSLRKPSLNQSLLSMVEHMKNPPSSAGSMIATNLLKLEKNYPPHYSFPICLLEYSLRNSIIIEPHFKLILYYPHSMENILQARQFYRTQYEALQLQKHLKKHKQITLDNARKFFNKNKKN